MSANIAGVPTLPVGPATIASSSPASTILTAPATVSFSSESEANLLSPAFATVGPTATLVSATATQINLSATMSGTGSYTYQWYRGTAAGFTPSPATLLPGATALTLGDVPGNTPGVPYFYILAANDGTATSYSNQVIGALSIPTTPISIPFQSGPVVLAYMGSSTWAINQGSGQVPTMIDQNIRSAYPNATLTTISAAQGGTTTTDFLPGAPNNKAVKNAITASTGYKVLRLMIGSNDAGIQRSVSGWLSNMRTIINDALTWPVDLIVLEEIGVRLDAGNTTLDLIRQYNAARTSLLGPKVVLGTSYTYENEALHLNTLSGDKIHQTDAGQIEVAANQTTEVAASFTAPPLQILNPTVDSSGTLITATLSQNGYTPASGTPGFSLSGTTATIASWSISGTAITYTLNGTIALSDSVALSAAPGSLIDSYGNAMPSISNLPVWNDSSTLKVTSPNSAFYATLDSTQTHLQISAGTAPLATPTYQLSLSAFSVLTFNFSGQGDALYLDFRNSAPNGLQIAVNGLPGANNQLYVQGISPGQFEISGNQVSATNGPSITFNLIDFLQVNNGGLISGAAFDYIPPLFFA